MEERIYAMSILENILSKVKELFLTSDVSFEHLAKALDQYNYYLQMSNSHGRNARPLELFAVTYQDGVYITIYSSDQITSENPTGAREYCMVSANGKTSWLRESSLRFIGEKG